MRNTNKLREQRINRINELKLLILTSNKKGNCASYKKTMTHYCLITGISKRTVKEYLDLLIDSEIITKKGDDLEYNE